jgi:hypothetical protein
VANAVSAATAAIGAHVSTGVWGGLCDIGDRCDIERSVVSAADGRQVPSARGAGTARLLLLLRRAQVRGQAVGLVEVLPRLGVPAAAFEQPGQLVVGLEVVASQRQRLADLRLGARQVALFDLPARHAQREGRGLRVGLALVEPPGLGEGGRRPLAVVLLLEQLPERKVGLG